MYPVTARTTPHRLPERVSYDRAAAYAILDEAYVCHLAFTAPDGPRVLPTLHVRVDDTLYLHGSTGSGPVLAMREGGPVCVAVTLLDALVLARSRFHHSANYRSVVVHANASVVTDDRIRSEAFDALVRKEFGDAGLTRPLTRKEMAAAALLAVPLTEVSVKARTHGVADEPEDLTLPYWAGVIPLRLTPGVPEPAPGVTVPVPPSLTGVTGWHEPVVRQGDHVRLEPLDLCHAGELFTALDDPEVHRYIPAPRPVDVEGMRDAIRGKLAEQAAGRRVAWTVRLAGTGEVVGTTSYCPPDEANRTVHIGSTQVGRPWWRTAVNTETKLLLMTRAFEELGAVRVEWQTDALNERSQRAIERLGATREGVLRRHKRRGDGTHRDSVFYGMTDEEWPAAKKTLVDRLARG